MHGSDARWRRGISCGRPRTSGGWRGSERGRRRRVRGRPPGSCGRDPPSSRSASSIHLSGKSPVRAGSGGDRRALPIDCTKGAESRSRASECTGRAGTAWLPPFTIALGAAPLLGRGAGLAESGRSRCRTILWKKSETLRLNTLSTARPAFNLGLAWNEGRRGLGVRYGTSGSRVERAVTRRSADLMTVAFLGNDCGSRAGSTPIGEAGS